MTAYGDDEENIGTNPSTETHIDELVQRRLSRRTAIIGGLATTVGFMAPGLFTPVSAHSRNSSSASGRKTGGGLLGYAAIPLGYGDDVVVPKGYSATPFLPWGTPIIAPYPAFVPGGNTGAQQEQQVGMHHDGMHFFPIDGSSSHGLLVLNHEYTDEAILHTGSRTGTRPTRPNITADQVRKSQAAHGVSVVEIRRDAAGEWSVVRGAKNRRVTANTQMTFSGPAAGHRLVRTAADPTGRNPIGTINNCAHGYTPWGTYLTCEENFNGYFNVKQVEGKSYTPEQSQNLSRYNVSNDNRYLWSVHDKRFELTPDAVNEVNRFGWVVEIDPQDPTSTPIKRTALGRTKHEGAFVHVTKGKRVVVYMGDDQVDEFAYKFVSSANYTSLLARGKSPLDEGTLYVAKFRDDGRGEWIPLVQGRPGLTAADGFADQGDVLVKTRQAATKVGATPMHRPEWTSVDPNTGAVYLTLSNDGGASSTKNAANPRNPNKWGSVIRWYEDGDDHAATAFTWDLLLLAGPGDGVDDSTVDADDAFGSPDGLWVDRDSRIWIQTDGTQPTGANDQMLAANPFVVDGAGRPEVKRFFTGVKGCEVTGVIDTPDQRTMFVNLQHPGDGVPSTWPGLDGLSVPRSATVIVTKDDGGVIGS